MCRCRHSWHKLTCIRDAWPRLPQIHLAQRGGAGCSWSSAMTAGERLRLPVYRHEPALLVLSAQVHKVELNSCIGTTASASFDTCPAAVCNASSRHGNALMRPQISELPSRRWHCAQLCNVPKEAEGQNAQLSLDCGLNVTTSITGISVYSDGLEHLKAPATC